MSLTVGQKLWCVPTDYRRMDALEVTVVRIGRRYAHIDMYGQDNYRVYLYDDNGDLHTKEWPVDGGQYSSPACCYLSRDVYEEARRLEMLYSQLRNRMCLSDGVTSEHILQAAALLKIQLDDKP